MHKYAERKTKLIRENGRSADFTSPNIIINCNMLCVYCYQHRHNESTDLNIATNLPELLQNILNHRNKLGKKVPNQCDKDYWLYEIACNTDLSRTAKYIDWQEIFEFARTNDLKFTFATKWFNKDFLTFNPERKVRIRLSLLPEKMVKIMDKGTHSLDIRLNAMEELYNANYDVQINLSPIIVYDGWLEDYKELFRRVKEIRIPDLKAECIFLTHEEKKHLYNQEHYPEAEKYLWTPEIQESKISQYSGKNIRYKWQIKNQYINQFKSLLNQELGCEIRYIF